MLSTLSKKYKKISYSQSGEDIIIQLIINQFKLNDFNYLDIGAFHPFKLNNTAIFYQQGYAGINVEPNCENYKLFVKYRKNDQNLNFGIADKSGVLDYYCFVAETLNTFSKKEAENCIQKEGIKLKEIKQIKVIGINEFIVKYIGGSKPHFLSLDAEGYDTAILKAIDFAKFTPEIICVETLSFSHHGKGKKDYQLIEYLKNQGYFVYADTYINSIFVNKKLWESR